MANQSFIKRNLPRQTSKLLNGKTLKIYALLKLKNQISKTEKLLKLEKFLKESLWQYALILAVICLTAYTFSKWIEAICFCVAHFILRPKFDKQYHSTITALCLFVSSLVAFFGITLTLPTNISLLSSIPISIFVCWFGNVLADRIELIVENKLLLKICEDYDLQISELLLKIQQLEHINFYGMTEIELRQYGASKKLSDLQQDILVLIVLQNYRIVDICKERNYSRTTIKYHVSQIKEKLNISEL